MSTLPSSSSVEPSLRRLFKSKLARIGVFFIMMVLIRTGVRYVTTATQRKPADSSVASAQSLVVDNMAQTKPAGAATAHAVPYSGPAFAVNPNGPLPVQNPATGQWEAQTVGGFQPQVTPVPTPTISTAHGWVIGGPNIVAGTQSPNSRLGPIALRREIAALEASISADERRILGLRVLGGAVCAGGIGLQIDGRLKPQEELANQVVRGAVEVVADGYGALTANEGAAIRTQIELKQQRIQQIRVQLAALANEVRLADSLLGCWGFQFGRRGTTSLKAGCYVFSADGTMRQLDTSESIAVGTYEIVNDGISIQWAIGIIETASVSWLGANPNSMKYTITNHTGDPEQVGLDFVFTRLAASPDGTNPVGSAIVEFRNNTGQTNVGFQLRWKYLTGEWTDWQDWSVDDISKSNYCPGGLCCEIRFGTKVRNYNLVPGYAPTVDFTSYVAGGRKFVFVLGSDGIDLNID